MDRCCVRTSNFDTPETVGVASFWGLWTLYFALHLITMWIVFAYLLANVRVVGTLYAVPFAAIEAFVLLALFSKRQAPRSLQSTRQSSEN